MDGDHEYETPPLAESVALEPAQTEVEEPAVMVGIVFTVTVVTAVLKQPSLLPVTVYVVVEEGLAITVAPVDAESEAAGAQL